MAKSRISKKGILICAQSNAAVNEATVRARRGVKTVNGEIINPKIVRIGQLEKINSEIHDLTLEYLADERLGVDYNKKLFKLRNILSLVNIAKKDLSEALSNEYSGSKRKELSNLLAKADELISDLKIEIADIQFRQSNMSQESLDEAKIEIIQEADIIVTTLSSSVTSIIGKSGKSFDMVIIDEAGQAVEPSLLIPLRYNPAQCIMIGDTKQLPPTVFSDKACHLSYDVSLFERMLKNFPDRSHFLNVQFRMHSDISHFPNQQFYDGTLIDGRENNTKTKRDWHESKYLGTTRFFDMESDHEKPIKGTSIYNPKEIDVIMSLYLRLLDFFGKSEMIGKIGVISPYKGQIYFLKNRFSAKFGKEILSEIEFNTIDGFQGKEKEIIIFSCVRGNNEPKKIGFLSDVRRMNVACTRAQCSFWIFGNSEVLKSNPDWCELISSMEDRNFLVKLNNNKFFDNSDLFTGVPKPLIDSNQADKDEDDKDYDDEDNEHFDLINKFSSIKLTDKRNDSQISKERIIEIIKLVDSSSSELEELSE